MVLAVLAALVALGSVGCTTLPESGAIHRQAADRPDRPQDAPYFNPPGPAKDGSPAAIVSGFFVAMQANPLSTSVARTFLSEHARGTWKPNRGTIVYEAFSVVPTNTGAKVRLADVRRLDARGGWRGGSPGRAKTLDIRLVSENGQWRIDNPVNALAVPSSYFDRSFARFNLYFYDQTGRTLLPDPVFIPRGEQSATNLVRGLLAGPGSAIADVTRSALPSRTDLDLSVVVTENGVAEVPLSREVLQASPSELSRVVDQLAWTLRQVPGIERVRITVAGTPVPLPGGGIDAPVTSGPQLDAAGPGRCPALGPAWWPGGRPRRLGPGPGGRRPRQARVRAAHLRGGPGPTGSSPESARTAGPCSSRRATGRRHVGSAIGQRPPAPVVRHVRWPVARGPHRARVPGCSTRAATQVREIEIPGVTGAQVAAFSVARDGSRMAVAYSGSPAPAVRVTDILRTDEGIVSGAGRSSTFAPGTDASRVVDIGWRDPSTLAVLSRTSVESSKVSFVSSDGSPTSPTLTEPTVFRGAAEAMVVAPDPALPLRLITPDQRLYTLSSNGQWPRTSSKVAAAAYAR